jgi:hypothetical protein
MELLALLGPKVLGALGSVFAFFAAAIALYYKGKATGASRERDRQARATLDAVTERRDVDQAISGMSGDDARQRLRDKWQR